MVERPIGSPPKQSAAQLIPVRGSGAGSRGEQILDEPGFAICSSDEIASRILNRSSIRSGSRSDRKNRKRLCRGGRRF
jgi:hypothetical protein